MTTIAIFSQHEAVLFRNSGGSVFARRVRMLRRTIAFIGCVCLLGAALDALQLSPFKAGNRTVAVYATVTTAGGGLVTDLAKDHFTIDDNGKRQELTIFTNEIQPITLVLLLDRSGSMEGNFDLVRDAAKEFVKQMLPDDKAR